MMASVWEVGTQVRLTGGVYAGHAGIVTHVDTGRSLPIAVKLYNVKTHLIESVPDDLEVVR